MKTDTPRTDEEIFEHPSGYEVVISELAYQLERELTAVTEQRDRLEEALRRVIKWMNESGYYDVSPYHQAAEALQSLTTNEP